jgi:LysM repeat protein
MPPAPGGGEEGLPPPVEVEFTPVEVAPAPAPAPGVPATPQVTRPKPAPRPGTPYTIKKGESLSAIAARNKMSWKKLAEYNRIADPNKVRAGQVILIPESVVSQSAAARPAPPPPSAGRGSTYVVQSGDNLTVVARRHNTTVSALKSENNLRSDRLLVGQILKLPAGSSKPDRSETRPAPAEVSEPATPATAIRQRPTPTPTPELVLEPEPMEDAPVGSEDPLVDKPFTIVVLEGDTLETIAANYVVSVEKIRELNNLPANATLKPGQKLEMPPGLY